MRCRVKGLEKSVAFGNQREKLLPSTHVPFHSPDRWAARMLANCWAITDNTWFRFQV